MNTTKSKHAKTIKRFVSKGWRVSCRGNLWREWHGLTIIVYHLRKSDRYRWVVWFNSLHGVHGERFESEKSAMKDLAKKLFDGRKFRKAYIQLKQCEPPW